MLTDSSTIKAYENALKDTMIYRYAEDYCQVLAGNRLVLLQISTMYIRILQCCDTFWVKSFNHQLLTYLPKCIHLVSHEDEPCCTGMGKIHYFDYDLVTTYNVHMHDFVYRMKEVYQ